LVWHVRVFFGRPIYALGRDSAPTLEWGTLGTCNRRRGSGPALAWRKGADYEYHLHYWRNGIELEFAAVVVQNDHAIPE